MNDPPTPDLPDEHLSPPDPQDPEQLKLFLGQVTSKMRGIWREHEIESYHDWLTVVVYPIGRELHAVLIESDDATPTERSSAKDALYRAGVDAAKRGHCSDPVAVSTTGRVEGSSSLVVAAAGDSGPIASVSRVHNGGLLGDTLYPKEDAPADFLVRAFRTGRMHQMEGRLN